MDILLSVHPDMAEMLMDNRKLWELRRVLPKGLNPGDDVFIYATSPIQRVIGSISVAELLRNTPVSELWNKTKDSNGVNIKTFYEYFEGRTTGNAIRADVRLNYPFGSPLTIQKFAEIFEMEISRPPQNFMYIK